MFLGDVSYLQSTRSVLMGVIACCAAILAADVSIGGASAAPTLTVLHSFNGYPDGNQPVGKLAMDSSGALYGTTYWGGTPSGCCGTVFKLTPPTAGNTQWTKTILYAFTGGSDGYWPLGAVILDSKGALYGTTSAAGVGGTVFKLTPPSVEKTQWNYTLLHSFCAGNDGCNPFAGLIMDSKGALYGTTIGGGTNNNGTVFKLTPPTAGKAAWTETVLYSFGLNGDGIHPQAGLFTAAARSMARRCLAALQTSAQCSS